MRFECAAAASRESDIDIPQNDNGNNFCQWVADNFDFNEDTLHGKNTTHVMGIISCITPKIELCGSFSIQRKEVSPEEILKISDKSLELK